MGESRGVEPGIVSSTPVFEGRRIDIFVDRVRFPNGSEADMEMIRHPGASAVLPVAGRLDDPDPEILLIRQYRYATEGYIWEVPAGVPDEPGEPWETCAHRELEEETGFRAGRMERMTHIWTTPGFTDEVIHLFVASDLEPGQSDLDADEFVEVVRMPFSRALTMVREGDITDCKSVATLLYAATFVIGQRSSS